MNETKTKTQANTNEKIEGFWRWFQAHASSLKELPKFKGEIYPLVIEALHQIDPGLVCDFEIDQKGKHFRLVISADGKARLFPLVMRVVGATEEFNLKPWEIVAFRQPRRSHFALQFPDYRISTDGIMYRAEVKDNKAVLELLIKDWHEDLPGAKEGVRVLLDNLLGEYAGQTKVKAVYPKEWRGETLDKDWLPLIRLYDELAGRLQSN